MGKKLTEEQREKRDAERAEQAKKVGEKQRRMPNIVLCTKDPETNAYVPAKIHDLEAICSENDGLVDRTECGKFLVEHKMLGVFYPVRVLKPIVREEQTVIKTVM